MTIFQHSLADKSTIPGSNQCFPNGPARTGAAADWQRRASDIPESPAAIRPVLLSRRQPNLPQERRPAAFGFVDL